MRKIYCLSLFLMIFVKLYGADLTYSEINEINDQQENVSKYAKFEIEGTSWLSFRDVPQLIQKYVKGTKTLDYGCGAGRSTRFLKSLGLDVIGVDISQKFLKEACKLDNKTHYCFIENSKIPAIDESYDLVFSSHVLLVVPTKQEMAVLFKEIHRVLKKGGIFIAVTGSEEMHSPRRKWISYETDFPENYNPKSGSPVKLHIKGVNVVFYDYNWTYKDYVSLLEDNGFEVLETHFPIGKEGEHYTWKSEKYHSPYIVYVVRKT